MYDIPRDLTDALAAAPDTLARLLRACTPEQARSTRSGDEGWNVVEVVWHLRDAEERALERMRLMRAGDRPFLAAYDQEAWARERDYAAQDLAAALADFRTLRATHVAELRALAPADWDLVGEHEEQGLITINAHSLHMVAHDAQHLAQLARVV